MTASFKSFVIVVIMAVLALSTAASFALLVCVNPATTGQNDVDGRSIATSVDPRPDPSISSLDIYVLDDDLNISSYVYGKTVVLHSTVYNLGLSNVTDMSVLIGIRSTSMSPTYNHTIHQSIGSVSWETPTNYLDVNYTWTVGLTVSGGYELWTLIDPLMAVDEQNETNNWAVIPFTINPLQVDIQIIADKDEYRAGETVIFTATVYYSGTVTVVPNLPGIVFMLVNGLTYQEIPDTRTIPLTGGIDGSVAGFIALPSGLAENHYSIAAEIMNETYFASNYIDFEVTSRPTGSVDLVMLAVIAISVAVVILIVYFVRRGNLRI